MSPLWFVAFAIFALTVLAVWLVLMQLRRRQILAQPNERSSHAVPTPVGGGIGVLIVLLPALVIYGHATGQLWKLATAAALAFLLALVSWVDDMRTLQALPRLAAHSGAAALGMFLLPGPILQGWVPPWLDIGLGVLAWVWFINLYNFMDGIDGITGAETAAIGFGLFLVASSADTYGLSLGDGLPALMLAAAAIGFLVWNWHPARVFLGDVGSVPLGFLAGWLLLDAAARGALGPALILPLYYAADATIVLLRRLTRGERVWEAHREHWYQRAVLSGLSHARVVLMISGANALLIALALWALDRTWPSLVAAAAVVAALLLYLGARRP
ncbi:MAG: glycosyltransferase family 4 protein [Alphaproteobacteria bacterium]|nr:glycosyltransferase family 4 protein [Alphaproteobacteria bacterium]